MQRIAEATSNWLENSGVIDKEENELYVYAVNSLLLSISPLLLAGIIGSLLGNFESSIILIIPFIFIRRFSGGYHTKKPWTCFFCSSTLLSVSIYLASIINYNVLLKVITLLSAISIMVWSPIDSTNRRLDIVEKKRFKRISTCITGIFLLLVIVFYYWDKKEVSICFSIGIILTAGLQIPCVLRDLFKHPSSKCLDRN